MAKVEFFVVDCNLGCGAKFRLMKDMLIEDLPKTHWFFTCRGCLDKKKKVDHGKDEG